MARHSTDASPRGQPGTQSVERAFALLRAFTDDQRVWTLADLSWARGLTKPTTLRLLGVLEREGMLQRTSPPGGYRLGAAAIALGALAQRANDLPTAARGAMERLMRGTGEAVSLEILAGREVMILDEVRGRFRGSWSESVGSRWPAHAAASGKVLLAAEREAESPAWRHFSATGRGRLPRYTDRTITSMTRLLAELDRVRRQGYATAVEELEDGYVAIGAPVRDHAGRVVAAICLGDPVTRLSPRRASGLVRQVIRAADAVSTGLGADAFVLNLTREQALDPAQAERLDGVGGIWFCGGDQARLTPILSGTPTLAAVRRRYREGAVVGGTSAGAAIMSDSMLTGNQRQPDSLGYYGDEYPEVRREYIEVVPGLGFLSGVIIDQH